MAAPAPISPLAPKGFPTLPPIEGVRFAAGAAGVRYQGRTDVMLALFDRPATVAGVFTRSKCPSATVDWCRAALSEGRARALVVNSGNANAFTGGAGVATTTAVAKATAKAIGAAPNEVYQASTGVIGEPMDPAPIVNALEARVKLGEAEVTINGIAKGAGMIAPDMATMLSFVFTDAPIAAPALQALLSKGVDRSFNAITVDSDTSTSDTLLIFSTGAAAAHGAPAIADAADPRLAAFRRALDKLLLDLAQQVVRDGEGARKFVEVRVAGAATRRAAKRIALAIANSPLVKTAVAGEDANWGRVVMAVGKSGEKAERDRLDIFFGDLRVAHAGKRDPDYSEAEASAYMKKGKIVIGVNVGVGTATAKVWTCDLTKDYIAINGDYRS